MRILKGDVIDRGDAPADLDDPGGRKGSVPSGGKGPVRPKPTGGNIPGLQPQGERTILPPPWSSGLSR